MATDTPNPVPEVHWPQEGVVPDNQFNVSEEHEQQFQQQ